MSARSCAASCATRRRRRPPEKHNRIDGMTDDCRIGDVLAFWREAGAEPLVHARRRLRCTRARAFPRPLATSGGGPAIVLGGERRRRAGARHRARPIPAQHVSWRLARAFSSDALAREVAARAISRGVDTRTDTPLLQFLYLPFMHSEELADQAPLRWTVSEGSGKPAICRGTCRHHPPLRALSAPKRSAWADHDAGREGLSRRWRVFGLDLPVLCRAIRRSKERPHHLRRNDNDD